MKKVLLVVNSPLLNAGVPRIMMDIFDGLRDKYAFEFLVYASKPVYYDDEIIKKGGRIHYIGPRRQMNWKGQYLYNLFIRPWRVLYILIKGKYDVLHSNSGFMAGDDVFLSWLCGVKTRISHGHGTYEIGKSILSFHPFLGRTLLKKFSTHSVAVSHIAGDTLFDGLDYELIFNSVDFTEYQKVAKQKHEGINLLQVGYYCHNKNQIFSMQICKTLHEKGINVRLYLIGYDIGEGYLPLMKEYIKENHLEEYVELLPHDYNKFDLYPIVDYMLIPSYTEGLPVVSMECQAANIQCLTSFGVSEDVDMGLLKRISINHIDQWIDYISSGKTEGTLDSEKMKFFSRETFLEKIQRIYSS